MEIEIILGHIVVIILSVMDGFLGVVIGPVVTDFKSIVAFHRFVDQGIESQLSIVTSTFSRSPLATVNGTLVTVRIMGAQGHFGGRI